MPELPIGNPPTLNIPKTIQQAISFHQQGRLKEAERLYENVLGAQPDHFDALHFLGILRAQQGNAEAAFHLISLALERQPRSADARSNLGNVLQGLGRYDEAIKCYDQALAIKPDAADALCNRGNALLALNRRDEALASYDRAVSIKPDFPQALNNRGNALHEMGRHDEAIASYNLALALNPEDVEVLNNRGSALSRLSRYDEAISSYDRALAINPRYIQALNNLGNALRDLGRPDAAIASYDRALAIKPDDAEILNNRGNALTELNRYREAIECYERAIELVPDYAEALSNLGTAFAEHGKRHEALDCYRKALALRPQSSETRWKRVMAILPNVAGVEESPAALREEFGRELAELDAWFGIERDDVHEAVGAGQPFNLAYQEQNNRELLSRYGTLCARLMKHWHDGQTFTEPGVAQSGVLRVGIVSAHIRDHSVWTTIIKGWLQNFDRDRFEFHSFHVGSKHDEETVWAQSHSTSFEHGAKALRQWVDLILAKRLDVLIYPEIGMDSMTVKLASLRLVPVQAAAWGHPETSGLPTMDYYLSAAALEPSNAQENYTERLVAFPRLGCCYTPVPVTGANPDLAVLGLDPQAPILLCPGTPFKYAPQHDQVFIDIARRLGRCRFVFFVFERRELSEKLRQRLKFNFSQAGLALEDYCAFIPWQNRAEFHGLMKRADVFLDTIGFSGFNTAMQAAECALPIVTREGRFMRGRLASGILRSMGMSELVAADEKGYVDLAVKLASDAGYRQSIRRRIETCRADLFGDVATVRALEDFLLKAAKRN